MLSQYQSITSVPGYLILTSKENETVSLTHLVEAEAQLPRIECHSASILNAKYVVAHSQTGQQHKITAGSDTQREVVVARSKRWQRHIIKGGSGIQEEGALAHSSCVLVLHLTMCLCPLLLCATAPLLLCATVPFC